MYIIYYVCIYTWFIKLMIENFFVTPSFPWPCMISTRPSMMLPSQGKVSNMMVLPASVLQVQSNYELKSDITISGIRFV